MRGSVANTTNQTVCKFTNASVTRAQIGGQSIGQKVRRSWLGSPYLEPNFSNSIPQSIEQPAGTRRTENPFAHFFVQLFDGVHSSDHLSGVPNLEGVV